MPLKMKINPGQEQNAVYHESSYGPIFGEAMIYIFLMHRIVTLTAIPIPLILMII